MPNPALATTALRPFLPAKDFDLSKRFYRDLGFTLEFEAKDIAAFSMGQHSFLLQNYYQEAWAANCMMQLMVQDLASWWRHIGSLALPERYGIKAPTAPARQPWGLEVAYLVDPSGVLWHIAQA